MCSVSHSTTSYWVPFIPQALGVLGRAETPTPTPPENSLFGRGDKQRYQQLLKGQCPTVSALLNVGMLRRRPGGFSAVAVDIRCYI